MQEETWLRDLVASPLVNECARCDAEVRSWARAMGVDEGLACCEAVPWCVHRFRLAANPTRLWFSGAYVEGSDGHGFNHNIVVAYGASIRNTLSLLFPVT